MERKVVEVILWIHFIGLSLTCPKFGDQWFPILNCPDFFPPYESSIKNMTLHNIFKCVHEADKDPNVSALVFHTDSNSGIKTCYLFDDVTEDCGDTIEGDYGLNKYLFQPIYCENGGSLSEDKLTCNCNDNAEYFGRFCTDLATDCKDLQNQGNGTKDRHYVYLQPGKPRINMTCHNGQTHLMYHDVNTNFWFNRSWAEYQYGFEDNGNYWIGLENIHYLTMERNHNDLFIEATIYDTDSSNNISATTKYTGFNVGDASDKFRMTFESLKYPTTYNLGHVFALLNNAPFSTYDKDNNNRPINCAMEYGGGWWYNSATNYERADLITFYFECAPANPTGYFWNRCVNCGSKIKNISTGTVFNGKVQSVELWLG